MAEEVYFKGWEGAKNSPTKAVVRLFPIACITSRSEGNATNLTEKVNVCTEGKTVSTPNSITRTVSISGRW